MTSNQISIIIFTYEETITLRHRFPARTDAGAGPAKENFQ
jgi:hypothetical protein